MTYKPNDPHHRDHDPDPVPANEPPSCSHEPPTCATPEPSQANCDDNCGSFLGNLIHADVGGLLNLEIGNHNPDPLVDGHADIANTGNVLDIGNLLPEPSDCNDDGGGSFLGNLVHADVGGLLNLEIGDHNPDPLIDVHADIGGLDIGHDCLPGNVLDVANLFHDGLFC